MPRRVESNAFIRWLIAFASLAAACCVTNERPQPSKAEPSWGMVVHGGAGTIARAELTPEKEAEIRGALASALEAGHAVLARGGSALDAAVAAVVILEDSPHFNAGKGAVFTHGGRNELDAAVMDGSALRAGSVAGLTRVKNPVLLARAVMERSPHVMMVGAGAEAFATREGIELVDPSYFFTQSRWDALQRALAAERDGGAFATDGGTSSIPAVGDARFGTVGAVALDQHGRLAAATSTGGMTNKRFGRVGDAPIIGAGTYANRRCAVSATGHGEYFIRYTVAHDICARVQYAGVLLRRAADEVVLGELVKAGGEGGVIAMTADGAFVLTFNSPGMYRGRIGPDGVPTVAIFGDEPLSPPHAR